MPIPAKSLKLEKKIEKNFRSAEVENHDSEQAFRIDQ